MSETAALAAVKESTAPTFDADVSCRDGAIGSSAMMRPSQNTIRANNHIETTSIADQKRFGRTAVRSAEGGTSSGLRLLQSGLAKSIRCRSSRTYLIYGK